MLGAKLNEIPILAAAEERAADGKNDEQLPTKRSPSKGRSLSDGSPPVLSPSPKFREPARVSKDDTSISDSPTTPRRPSIPLRGLSLQMPAKDFMNIGVSAYTRIPLSPKLDPADTYGSPVIPRRSRGLDFSRAATNLHHSTLAEQSSPDSSPTITGRAMNIPRRRSGQFTSHMDSAALWSARPAGDRTTVSSSLGSINMLCSESSSSSSDDDLMDADDIDDSILTTPQINNRFSGPLGLGAWPQQSPGNNWMMGPSPAASSLMNFQRARLRHGKNRKSSSSSSSMASPMSKSPPVGGADIMSNGFFNKDPPPGTHSRRESISWAANQLHISGSESDDGTLKSTLQNADNLPNTPNRDGQRGVVKRAVTRRGNMLPKTKNFARIRAALAEESTPLETEIKKEATVIRQVRENDMDLEPRRHLPVTTPHSSPSVAAQNDSLENIPEDDMLDNPDRISSSFKAHAARNSKGAQFWQEFEPTSHRTPPPPALLQQDSSMGLSEDVSMDSPSLYQGNFSLPSQPSDLTDTSASANPSGSPTRATTPLPPTAANVSRRVNGKRRREDDFDIVSFKRRAVSPGMSVHNSPVMQSPMQRDINPWVPRPASGSGSEKGGFESGFGNGNGTGNGNGFARHNGYGTKRVGLQGMVDTNDGLMKMSIE